MCLYDTESLYFAHQKAKKRQVVPDALPLKIVIDYKLGNTSMLLIACRKGMGSSQSTYLEIILEFLQRLACQLSAQSLW